MPAKPCQSRPMIAYAGGDTTSPPHLYRRRDGIGRRSVRPCELRTDSERRRMAGGITPAKPPTVSAGRTTVVLPRRGQFLDQNQIIREMLQNPADVSLATGSSLRSERLLWV